MFVTLGTERDKGKTPLAVPWHKQLWCPKDGNKNNKIIKLVFEALSLS